MKRRDPSEEEGSPFNTPDEFFKWAQDNLSSVGNGDNGIKDLKEDLKKRNIRIVTEDVDFLITTSGIVNRSIRTIEAFVSLDSQKTTTSQPTTPSPGATPQTSGFPPTGLPGGFTGQQKTNPGMKITFMRIK